MEGDVVTMQEIFRFQQTGVDQDGRVQGSLEPTGIRPTFAEKFEQAGIAFDWGTLAGSWG
jgi:pilus assembly protein CpaF